MQRLLLRHGGCGAVAVARCSPVVIPTVGGQTLGLIVVGSRTVSQRKFAVSKASLRGGGPEGFGREIRRLRKVDDILAFHREHRDFLTASDLCLLLEGLRAAHAKLQDDGDITEARRTLFNTIEFMNLMKDVVRKLETFRAEELPRTLASLQDLRWTDKHLFKLAEPLVIRDMPSMGQDLLPRIVSSYVEVRCGSRILFDELVHRCTQSVEDLNDGALVDLVCSFSKSPHKPKSFLMGVSQVIADRIPNLSPDQLVRLADAYVSQARDISDDFVFRFCERVQREQLFANMSPSQAVLLLRALALWSRHNKRRGFVRKEIAATILSATGLLLDAGSGALQPRDATIALWAFSRVAVASPQLLRLLYEDLLEEANRLPETSIAHSLLVTARGLSGQLQFSESPSQEACRPWAVAKDPQTSFEKDSSEDTTNSLHSGCPFDTRLMDACESRVQKVIGNFKVRDLSSVVLAYALAHSGSAELFAVLQRACLDKCHDMPMEQTSSVLWSFATIRLGPALFREVQIDVLERINQLTVHGVCDVLWSYCVVKHHDAHFFKALLSTLVPSKVAGDPRCALLCPALLDIRAHLPELDPDGLDRYAGYARGEFRQQQLAAAAPASVRSCMTEILADLQIPCEELVDVNGYVVDVLVHVLREANKVAEKEEEEDEEEEGEEEEEEEGKAATAAALELPVALLYHSPRRTLHARTNEPLGQTMMRQRHLRHCGYVVVNIWERTWDSLDARQRSAMLLDRITEARNPLPQSVRDDRSARPRARPANGGGGGADSVERRHHAQNSI